jgi:hypothetical protein
MEKILYKCISYEDEHGTYVYASGEYVGKRIQMLNFIEKIGKSVHLFESQSFNSLETTPVNVATSPEGLWGRA